jgi:hypothetical protein
MQVVQEDDAAVYTEAPTAEFRLGRGTVMVLVIDRMIGECILGSLLCSPDDYSLRSRFRAISSWKIDIFSGVT